MNRADYPFLLDQTDIFILRERNNDVSIYRVDPPLCGLQFCTNFEERRHLSLITVINIFGVLQ